MKTMTGKAFGEKGSRSEGAKKFDRASCFKGRNDSADWHKPKPTAGNNPAKKS